MSRKRSGSQDAGAQAKRPRQPPVQARERRPLNRHAVADGQDGYFFMAPDQYTEFEYLAKGTFGVVCTATVAGKSVIVKKLHCKNLVYAESALRELWNLTFFAKHKAPGVVKMLDCWVHEDAYVYMVLERFDRSLDKCIPSKHRLSAAEWRRVASMLIHALHDIHSSGSMHRDLKPENVVVDADCTKMALIDLGSVRAASKEKLLRPLTPIYEVSTEGFRGPELLSDATVYGKELDVFSCGCLLANLKLGRELFPSDDDLQEYTEMDSSKASKFLAGKLKGLAKNDKLLLTSMLVRDPAKRITTSTLVQQAPDPSPIPLPGKPRVYSEPDYVPSDFSNIISNIHATISDFHSHPAMATSYP